jgi:hypothetical protein
VPLKNSPAPHDNKRRDGSAVTDAAAAATAGATKQANWSSDSLGTTNGQNRTNYLQTAAGSAAAREKPGPSLSQQWQWSACLRLFGTSEAVPTPGEPYGLKRSFDDQTVSSKSESILQVG